MNTLLRIASAKSKNAWSILIFALALVSKNLMPCSRAMASPRSLLTALSFMSHLFPKIIFSTSSLACLSTKKIKQFYIQQKNLTSSILRSHLAMLSKLFEFVIS